ncbi:MAG: glutamine--fructose-6-phosphate transaminase (isomerizing) [Dethiobacteria bacterium]|jgi:glucosamine--fructose-6-phosphate aminotransferase (isomerizing)|nr:glutamine--fructose-6-phosphate transaminase (isomerizing) [Bacillota bacterium]
MCGIVGYIGTREAYPILLEGLYKLEYRGYDSAGLALLDSGVIQLIKGVGEISKLEEKVGGRKLTGCVGIAHSRWATHGRPSDGNAHPHSGCSENFVVVHNGIIENYQSLRSRLKEQGHRFSSETDTEVLAHLVEQYYDGDLLEAVQRAIEEVRGSYAIVVMSAYDPERLICARKHNPLIIGLGDGENMVASDLPAILSHTRRTYFLEDGEMAEVKANEVNVFNQQGERIEKEIFEVTWDAVAAEKGGYPHFMIKEIMEQPQAIRETLRGRIDAERGKVCLADDLHFSCQELKNYRKIWIVACGTAYHAGLVGKYLFEKLVRIPVEVDLASEFRYRDPMLDKDSLVIVISQSGETADTLAALRLAKTKGIKILAITNVVGSSVAREADEVLFTWAGPEIAVASTKAYITQLIALYLLAIYFAESRGMLEAGEEANYIKILQSLPEKINEILADTTAIEEVAAKISSWENAFFIGRNLDYAVAMEGSLKLKETSYIHAESYAAGELKHGALALITKGIPVFAVATQEEVFEKTVSNIKEIKARDAFVIAFTFQGKEELAEEVDQVFYLPCVSDFFAPVLSVVPLQLVSYYTAVKRGCSVDKPRNLAKSVTVE